MPLLKVSSKTGFFHGLSPRPERGWGPPMARADKIRPQIVWGRRNFSEILGSPTPRPGFSGFSWIFMIFMIFDGFLVVFLVFQCIKCETLLKQVFRYFQASSGRSKQNTERRPARRARQRSKNSIFLGFPGWASSVPGLGGQIEVFVIFHHFLWVFIIFHEKP